jgi:hypothetical protein
MSQESLNFGRLDRVGDCAREVYRKLNDAIDEVGIVTAAGACGMDRGDLRKQLDRKKGQHSAGVWVEDAMNIAALCSSDTTIAIAAAFCRPLGLRAVDALPPMTDKERADRCEAALDALGPIGKAARLAALGVGAR